MAKTARRSRRCLRNWRQAANAVFTFHAESYAAFFDALIGERILRGLARAHPRLKILGLLEARLIGADRLVLAGLDETVWPPRFEPNSFLNRAMRAELKLSSPDRRIGQTAHDFAQAFCAPELIVTRAKKRGGAPTTPSRFLQRMEALAGPEIFKSLRERGAGWLDLARRVDKATPVKPLTRPEPRPPLSLRPQKLSVTRIEMLRRDPYAIYAEYILELLPLPPLDAALGPREIGNALHEVLEEFCKRFPSGPLPDDARKILVASAQQKLAAFAEDAEFQSFRWPRLLQGLDAYLAYEAERRPSLATIFAEKGGRLTLQARRRLDIRPHGKSRPHRVFEGWNGGRGGLQDRNAAVAKRKCRAGWSPQLTLEAAMLSSGAFRDVPARLKSRRRFICRSAAAGKSRAISATSKKGPFDELAADHFQELLGLLNHFRNPANGYPARPFPQFSARYNAYDHLARTREWSASGEFSSVVRRRRVMSGPRKVPEIDPGAAGARLRSRRPRPGCRPMPAPARPMCWRKGWSACCWPERRPAAFCA